MIKAAINPMFNVAITGLKALKRKVGYIVPFKGQANYIKDTLSDFVEDPVKTTRKNIIRAIVLKRSFDGMYNSGERMFPYYYM